MSNRFLISVAAAALIAGTGVSNAQNPGHDGGQPVPRRRARLHPNEVAHHRAQCSAIAAMIAAASLT